FVSAEISVLNQIEQLYNINERVPLKVAVSYTEEIDGSVKSSIICDNANVDYFVTPFYLKTSPQEITIPELKLTKNMLGKCSLEVSLSDDIGTLLDKKVASIFEVSQDLILTVNINKNEFSPGNELKIDGDVKNIRGELLKTGVVKISLDNQSFNAELRDGKFSYSYNLASDIKSNAHLLRISLEDGYGNKASKEFSIFIIPKPASLKLLLNKIDFLPEEKINIESLLYDQANDLIENEAEIKVYDPEEKLVRQGKYKLDFTLDQYAPPGNWLIKASTDDFKIQSSFSVAVVKKVQVYVEDGVVYVKNVGNVPYDDEVEVSAIGEDGREFTKRIKIDPKESRIIKLSDELKEGQYNLDVLSNNEKNSFENIQVPKRNDLLFLTGEIISTAGNKLIDQPYLIVLIILAVTLFAYYRVKSKKTRQFMKEKEMQLGYNRAREIEQQKIKKGIKPRRFNIDEKEAKDFTNRMLRGIKQQDGKDKFKDDDESNLSSMFK
ncbi:MAG: hypothetical protein AABW45_02025, partial [Nanoarchaeota archaeon]